MHPCARPARDAAECLLPVERVVSNQSSESQPDGQSKQPIYDEAVRAMARTAARIRRADTTLIDQVRARPLASIAIALAAGYVVGRLLSRRG